MNYLLAIDQGTTSSRAILFAAASEGGLEPRAQVSLEFAQSYPAPGWVEHDAEEILATVLCVSRAVLEKVGAMPAEVAALGITNQRETVVIWDRASGKPIAPAIVWQDRRTAPACAALRAEGQEPMVTARTGLLLDPYFSATKIAWLLDHIPDARRRAEAGELAFGTIDSWLIWHMTGGRLHATDATNASRTLLYDIHKGAWCPDLCRLFGVPMALLPEVRDCAGDFGTTDPALFGVALPIRGVAGDQQAASMGQACFTPGMMKSTYGTGCFALMHTGATPVASQNRMLTTLASQFGGKPAYALEGSIFVAGAVVQWLRDGLSIIDAATEVGPLAEAARGGNPAEAVVIVPAFTGLGAPYWAPSARGAIFGLTRGTGRAELARAALESVGLQTADLMAAMRADWAATQAGPGTSGAGAAQTMLRVDGGLSASNPAMQFLADILATPIDRPQVLETTALGVAWAAGWASGLCPGPEGFATLWACERRFTPAISADERQQRLARWQSAVAATLAFG